VGTDVSFKRDNSLRPNPAKIREMFGNITSRYDFFNHALSLGHDIFWRRALSRRLLALDPPGRFLDLACGSGDQMISAHKLWPKAILTGLDFSRPMLDLASSKIDGFPASLILGDILDPPFESDYFDSISISFGLRNVADREELYRQVYRVLKPGGRFLILELFFDSRHILSPIVGFHVKKVTPWVAGRIFNAPLDAYRYLGVSVLRFPHPAVILDELEKVGYVGLGYRVYTLGVAMLAWGHKPTAGPAAGI
jgi:demethylmenaquinone methyltransferase/2-methoxy-6-polyprenyl-1,4-benzoquinol methylase